MFPQQLLHKSFGKNYYTRNNSEKKEVFFYLNVGVTGANSEVIALLDPRDRGDVVLQVFHFQQLLDVTRARIPQVDMTGKTHCQQVSRRPVNQVQVCNTQKKDYFRARFNVTRQQISVSSVAEC